MPKKISFPNRACPKCGKAIHIKMRQHDCGWKADAHAETPSAIIKRPGPAKKKAAAKPAAAPVTVADIQAVKDVVNKLGADTVKELAKVLEK